MRLLAGKDTAVGSSDSPYELLDEDPTCALCEAHVTLILAAPSRQRITGASTVYRSFAWCRLQPCGHTFAVRRGSLIH